MKYLFVAGCPRSGTTAMVNLLNGDERIAIGLERFKFIRKQLKPALFEKERFFTLSDEETNLIRPEHYEHLKKRWDRGSLVYVGDKVPQYYSQMGRLCRRFEPLKIVMMLRDLEKVADSFNRRAYANKPSWPKTKDYREAVKQWNTSLNCVKELCESPNKDKMFLVKYELFFNESGWSYLRALYDFLELPLTSQVETGYVNILKGSKKVQKKERNALEDEHRAYLKEHKEEALEKWCINNCIPYIIQSKII